MEGLGARSMQSQNQTQDLLNIVARLLKAKYVKPAETAVAKKRLCKHGRC
jgi:hypothetical protein